MNFSKIIKRISEGLILSGYSRTAQELNLLSDKQLADIGINRELLKLGAKAFPWREEEVAKIIPNNVTTLTSAKVEVSTTIMSQRPKAA